MKRYRSSYAAANDKGNKDGVERFCMNITRIKFEPMGTSRSTVIVNAKMGVSFWKTHKVRLTNRLKNIKYSLFIKPPSTELKH